jgi:ribose 5-phosphate isomerase A
MQLYFSNIRTMMQNSTTIYHISHYMDHCDVVSLINFGLLCKNSYKIIKEILNKIRELSEQLYVEFDGFHIRMCSCVDMIKQYGLKQPWPLGEIVKFNMCLYPERSNPDNYCFPNYNIYYPPSTRKIFGFRIPLKNILSNNVHDEQKKKRVAEYALKYIPDNGIIGIGTGSTVNYFIEFLAEIKNKIKGTVASSNATEILLKSHGIPVFDLNAVEKVDVYIDGADQYNSHHQLVKGGGAALTRKKIVCAASCKFVCLVTDSKEVKLFGSFPIPIEVIPMARTLVTSKIRELKGNPVYREDVITDNGNIIIDVHDWIIKNPIKLEQIINNITGVVSNGIFANKPADILLVGTRFGVICMDQINRMTQTTNQVTADQIFK